jgi:transcription initiation factor IIF auxiliary subunit
LNANDLRSNVLLQHVIQKVFGKTYETRLEEAEQERRELEQITRQVVKLYIGNRHRLEDRTSGQTWHKWTLFVRMDEDIDEADYIESVTVYLHPTFTPNTIVLREPPYEVSRLGWGVFNIKLKIRFLSKFNKQPLEVSHFLSFTGNGDFNSEDVEFVTRKYDSQAESDQDMSLEGQ